MVYGIEFTKKQGEEGQVSERDWKDWNGHIKYDEQDKPGEPNTASTNTNFPGCNPVVMEMDGNFKDRKQTWVSIHDAWPGIPQTPLSPHIVAKTVHPHSRAGIQTDVFRATLQATPPQQIADGI